MTGGISVGQAFPAREHAALWLVRYGELALKSPGVRDVWERQLMKNIRETQPPGCKVSHYAEVWI